MKNEEFNNILDECLERILNKGETVEQCLAGYPEQAAELEPLLQTALTVKKVSAIQPRPEFTAKARYQFRSALQTVKPKRKFSFFGWQSRWATAVAVVLILLLAGSGTVFAADNSMPDSPLYPVKLAVEQVRVRLTPSDIGRAELYTKLADRRVAEIAHMASKGKPERVEWLTQRLDTLLVRVAVLATVGRAEDVVLAPAPTPAPAPVPGAEREPAGRVPPQAARRARLRMSLIRYATDNPAMLRAVLERAPESARPALLQAIEVSLRGYQQALKALEETD